MRHNDIDLENWKESDVNVDSLWLINGRDKTGKHSNKYHGNFIPQIPYQLIKRYTKKHDIVLDMFLGSGTTLFECEKLKGTPFEFYVGDENYTEELGCKGCYQYDPVEYRKTVVVKVGKLAANVAVETVFKKLYPKE